MKKKPILLPLGVALAAVFPHATQAKVSDAGQSLGRAQGAISRTVDGAGAPLLALPTGGTAKQTGHYSHTSHRSHHSHYSSSGGGGHYSHSSHSSHYSSS